MKTNFDILIAWVEKDPINRNNKKEKQMIQQEMFDCAERRNSRLPNFVARRVSDLVRHCAKYKQGEFYYRLVALVSDYSLYMTGV